MAFIKKGDVARRMQGTATELLTKKAEDLDWGKRNGLCDKCGGRIDAWPFSERGWDYHIIEGRTICSDCYYKELGDVVEKHGLGIPHGPPPRGCWVGPGD